jgi:integrase
MATFVKLPSGKWQAQVRKRPHPTRTKTFRTKLAAQTWAREMEDALDKGTAPDKDAPTMDSLLARYERDVSASKRGKAQERTRLRRMAEHFEGVRPHELTVEAVLGFVRRDGVGDDTVRRELALLSSVLETARDMWGVRMLENPARTASRVLNRTKTLKRKVARDRRLRPGEYKRLLRASSTRLRRIIRLILETAMRRSEIVRLRPAHVRPDGLLVPEDKTQTNAVIPLSRRARRIIEALGPDGFGVRPDSITQAFDRACQRAGIEGLRVHDLRHEATSRMFEKGLSIEEVATVTRHSDWRSLKIYTHPSRSRVAEKLNGP